MSLAEHYSTFVDTRSSSSYAMYIKWCVGCEWTVSGKVMAAVMENGETILTVAPLTEFDATRGIWYTTRFNRCHKVHLEDVSEFTVIPAAAVS